MNNKTMDRILGTNRSDRISDLKRLVRICKIKKDRFQRKFEPKNLGREELSKLYMELMCPFIKNYHSLITEIMSEMNPEELRVFIESIANDSEFHI